MFGQEFAYCYTCGEEFPKNGGMYCSAECRTYDMTKVKSCAHCNTEFHRTAKAMKYCSPACRQEARKQQQCKSPLPKTIKCAICPNNFTPVTGSHKYCSVQCKTITRAAIAKKSRSTEHSKAKVSAYNKTYKRYKNPRDMRNRNLKACYGINIEEFEAMEQLQGGVCFICHDPPPGKKPLCVDHCHTTGVVRSLLCINCNNILGGADDSIRILEASIEYLKEHKAPQEGK